MIDLACMREGVDYEMSYEALEDLIEPFFYGDNGVYDRLEFAKKLRRLVKNRASIQSIADWAFNVFQYERISDNVIYDIAYTLSLMCCHEFEYSYEELDDIANRLILGEDVKL